MIRDDVRQRGHRNDYRCVAFCQSLECWVDAAVVVTSIIICGG